MNRKGKDMRGTWKVAIGPLSALALLAAGPSYRGKSIDQWTEQDARQVLASSPWVKHVMPSLLPKLSEDQLRSGGKMGGGEGLGAEALNPNLFTGTGQAPGKHGPRPSLVSSLEVRWESSGAVRAAEVKSHAQDAPDLQSGVYAIAVYDVPGLDVNDKTLPYDLKRGAMLQREGKKETRATQVDVLPQGGGLCTVIYSFPRSKGSEITLHDRRVTFSALIGRLALAQYFYMEEMEVGGKLEL
jgi:hypothetical protein